MVRTNPAMHIARIITLLSAIVPLAMLNPEAGLLVSCPVLFRIYIIVAMQIGSQLWTIDLANTLVPP